MKTGKSNWKLQVQVLFVLTACFFVLTAQNTYSFLKSKDMQKELETVLNDILNGKDNVLGAIVEIDIPGKGTFHTAYGFSDKTKSISLKPDFSFAIGSVTKMFISTIVNQLIEEGKVKLGDPVIKYLPENWAAVLGEIEYGEEMTVLHALSHRTGLFDPGTLTSAFMKLIGNPSKKIPAFEVLQMAGDGGKPYFKPGAEFKYNDTNYLLLGAVIENVTGKSVFKVLKDNITSKIGLNNTFALDGKFGEGVEKFAVGYLKVQDKEIPINEFHSGFAKTSGSIISTVKDLNIFMKALVSGKLFRNSDTFQEMITIPENDSAYKKGIEVERHPENGLFYGHTGYFGGSGACVYYFPEKKVTISVCLTYLSGMTRNIWAANIAHQAVKHLTGD